MMRLTIDMQCPIFHIHGRKDETVPFNLGQRLYDLSQSPFDPWWVSDSHHSDIIQNHPEEYKERMLQFFSFCEQMNQPTLISVNQQFHPVCWALFPSMSLVFRKAPIYSVRPFVTSVFSRSIVSGPSLCVLGFRSRFPSAPSYDEKYGWQIAISPTKKISIRKVMSPLFLNHSGKTLSLQI